MALTALMAGQGISAYLKALRQATLGEPLPGPDRVQHQTVEFRERLANGATLDDIAAEATVGSDF